MSIGWAIAGVLLQAPMLWQLNGQHAVEVSLHRVLPPMQDAVAQAFPEAPLAASYTAAVCCQPLQFKDQHHEHQAGREICCLGLLRVLPIESLLYQTRLIAIAKYISRHLVLASEVGKCCQYAGLSRLCISHSAQDTIVPVRDIQTLMSTA